MSGAPPCRQISPDGMRMIFPRYGLMINEPASAWSGLAAGPICARIPDNFAKFMGYGRSFRKRRRRRKPLVEINKYNGLWNKTRGCRLQICCRIIWTFCNAQPWIAFLSLAGRRPAVRTRSSRYRRQGDQPMSDPAPQLDEIRDLMAHLPGPDLEAGTRRGAARAAADKAGRRARPARRAGGVARDLAGAPPAEPRSSAHGRVRRQSRRRRARRLGLSGRGDGADGAEFHRRRRRGEPAVPVDRRRSARLRDEPRDADRRHRRRSRR